PATEELADLEVDGSVTFQRMGDERHPYYDVHLRQLHLRSQPRRQLNLLYSGLKANILPMGMHRLIMCENGRLTTERFDAPDPTPAVDFHIHAVVVTKFSLNWTEQTRSVELPFEIDLVDDGCLQIVGNYTELNVYENTRVETLVIDLYRMVTPIELSIDGLQWKPDVFYDVTKLCLIPRAANHQPLIVVEFCKHGDLLRFIRKNKGSILKDEHSTSSDYEHILTIKELVSIAWQPMEMIEHLEEGHRPKQPIKCPNECYALMKQCWEFKADLRPTFDDLRLRLAVLLNMGDEQYENDYERAKKKHSTPTSATCSPSPSFTRQHPLEVEDPEEFLQRAYARDKLDLNSDWHKRAPAFEAISEVQGPSGGYVNVEKRTQEPILASIAGSSDAREEEHGVAEHTVAFSIRDEQVREHRRRLGEDENSSSSDEGEEEHGVAGRARAFSIHDEEVPENRRRSRKSKDSVSSDEGEEELGVAERSVTEGHVTVPIEQEMPEIRRTSRNGSSSSGGGNETDVESGMDIEMCERGRHRSRTASSLVLFRPVPPRLRTHSVGLQRDDIPPEQ
ncbi:unnamed protein product, partial [Mesorhabditis spiculigera]